MSFEADLRAHLLADATVAGLVGERIYPIVAPQNAPSVRITYSIIFGEPQNSLDGHSGGLTRYTVQLSCWSQSFKTVRDLAEAAKNRMDEAGATIRSVITSYPSIDDYESDTQFYHRAIDVSCWHTESV